MPNLDASADLDVRARAFPAAAARLGTTLQTSRHARELLERLATAEPKPVRRARSHDARFRSAAMGAASFAKRPILPAQSWPTARTCKKACSRRPPKPAATKCSRAANSTPEWTKSSPAVEVLPCPPRLRVRKKRTHPAKRPRQRFSLRPRIVRPDSTGSAPAVGNSLRQFGPTAAAGQFRRFDSRLRCSAGDTLARRSATSRAADIESACGAFRPTGFAAAPSRSSLRRSRTSQASATDGV